MKYLLVILSGILMFMIVFGWAYLQSEVFEQPFQSYWFAVPMFIVWFCAQLGSLVLTTVLIYFAFTRKGHR